MEKKKPKNTKKKIKLVWKVGFRYSRLTAMEFHNVITMADKLSKPELKEILKLNDSDFLNKINTRINSEETNS